LSQYHKDLGKEIKMTIRSIDSDEGVKIEDVGVKTTAINLEDLNTERLDWFKYVIEILMVRDEFEMLLDMQTLNISAAHKTNDEAFRDIISTAPSPLLSVLGHDDEKTFPNALLQFDNRHNYCTENNELPSWREKDPKQIKQDICLVVDTYTAVAQYLYARACLKGSMYIKKNGFEYLEKALKACDKKALFWYAEILQNGEHDVPIDIKGAERYYKEAKRRGHLDAEAALEKLKL
ncbi:11834_t:CDS:2, partial [Ambispora leptoticha]